MIDKSKKTATALGMFDGVHIGHKEVIRSALNQKDLQPAIFTFRVLKKSGGGSILPYNRKFSLLKEEGIKTIFSSDFESVRNLSAEEFVQEILIEKMNCGHVSCGWDFRFSKNATADSQDLKRICNRHGIEVNIIEPIEVNGEAVSSTRIRQAIRDGDVLLTNQMLGYDLSYELEVVEGAKLGRKLGFPTINQLIPEGCVLPKFGVYKSRVLVDIIHYIAVTNIGTKPTVNDGNSPLIETHIPGFNMDIYGQTVKVSLQEFIRDEKKFNSLDELKEQINLDVKEACK
jgi:riboflavin kinase/FMN adenylyltransferase